MERENRPAADDFENDVEQAMEDKLKGVLAADATGLVNSEIPPAAVILSEGSQSEP
jgi:hypothetical protein